MDNQIERVTANINGIIEKTAKETAKALAPISKPISEDDTFWRSINVDNKDAAEKHIENEHQRQIAINQKLISIAEKLTETDTAPITSPTSSKMFVLISTIAACVLALICVKMGFPILGGIFFAVIIGGAVFSEYMRRLTHKAYVDKIR